MEEIKKKLREIFFTSDMVVYKGIFGMEFIVAYQQLEDTKFLRVSVCGSGSWSAWTKCNVGNWIPVPAEACWTVFSPYRSNNTEVAKQIIKLMGGDPDRYVAPER